MKNWKLLIEDPEELSDWLAEAREARQALALDTESTHYASYNPEVALIQLATETSVVFIDPLSHRWEEAELRPLFDALMDEALEKVLHSARNDLMELDRDFSVGLRGLFDTEIAARFLGHSRSKLSYLYEELLGVTVPGGMHTFDWSKRPLTEKAIAYARSDVERLIELRDRLEEELARSPYHEAFRQTCAYIAETTTYRERPFDPEGWRRIKAARKFNGRQRAILHALYGWRHEVCEARNMAAFMVVQDHRLAALVLGKGKIGGLSKREAAGLEAALEQGRRAPEPPERRPSRGQPPSREEKARFQALRSWRNQTAEELRLPSEFVATNDTLSAMAAQPPQDLADLGDVEGVLPWQVELFGDSLLDALRSA